MGQLKLITKSKFYFPPTVDLLIRYYAENSKNNLRFDIPAIPPTLNQIWRKTKRGQTYLSNEARAFKEQLAKRINGLPQWAIEPEGVLAGMIVVESSTWLPKDPKKAKDMVRKNDIDNRSSKLVWDSLVDYFGFKDQRIWELPVFKYASVREKTHVFLFDLGVNIPYNGINE